MAEPLGVPYRVSVRLDDELRLALARYKETADLNTAQALRTALAVGLRTVETSIEHAFARQAFREGINNGVRAVKKAMQGMIAEAMAELET